MKTTVIFGARCFPPFGSFAVRGLLWSDQVGTNAAAPAATGNLHGAVTPGGRQMYRTRFCALINLFGIDRSVPHRMRVSASEP